MKGAYAVVYHGWRLDVNVEDEDILPILLMHLRK